MQGTGDESHFSHDCDLLRAEGESVPFGAIRRLGGVAILLHDCLLGKPSVIPFPYRVLWRDQPVTCLSLLGQ